MRPDVLSRLAGTPFAGLCAMQAGVVQLRYPLDADQLAESPSVVAYYVEAALQAHNVEFATEPTITDGMLVAALAPAADPIDFD